MGKKTSSPPPPPDPAKTAAAQAAANRETAIANAQIGMVDQTTPWGRVTYRELPRPGGQTPAQPQQQAPAAPSFDFSRANALFRQIDPEDGQGKDAYQAYLREAGVADHALNMDPRYLRDNYNFQSNTYEPGVGIQQETAPGDDYTPRYERIEELTPEGQRLLDMTTDAQMMFGETANRQLENLGGVLDAPMDMAAMGEMPTPNMDMWRQTADNMMARISPQMERQRAALETRLANQGIQYGTEAWRAAMDDYNRAMTDTRLAVDSAAGDEMARMYGLETDARSRALNEMLMARSQPLNEVAALMSGAQVQQPQFAPTPMPQMQAPDIMGATFGAANQRNAAWQQQQQNAAANTQGLFGLLGQGAMAYALMNPATAGAAAAPAFAFSDRRLKRNVRRIGSLASGLPLYLYRYIWGGAEQIGVMADEARALFPGAVRRIGAFDAVNYAGIG